MRIDFQWLADPADFICEADLGCVPDIVDILDHFGHFYRGDYDILIDRQINVAQHLCGALVIGADHCFRWMIEVGNGCAFAQEFRIEADAKVFAHLEAGSRLDFRNHDIHGGRRRNRTAHDHYVVVGLATKAFANGAGCRDYIAIIAATILGSRCADGDECNVGVCNRVSNTCGCADQFLFHTLREQFAQTCFMNWRFTPGDLLGL